MFLVLSLVQVLGISGLALLFQSDNQSLRIENQTVIPLSQLCQRFVSQANGFGIMMNIAVVELTNLGKYFFFSVLVFFDTRLVQNIGHINVFL